MDVSLEDLEQASTSKKGFKGLEKEVLGGSPKPHSRKYFPKSKKELQELVEDETSIGRD
ncbi:hypothetical protein [Helicobacter mehlei]|uniref:hypothetical protein n=1 Tax=Helicobacter mehlei TaxID=2316080 RepID=UPI0013CE0B41|nr:hypothetical protein [Helicobacter mehlei]